MPDFATVNVVATTQTPGPHAAAPPVRYVWVRSVAAEDGRHAQPRAVKNNL